MKKHWLWIVGIMSVVACRGPVLADEQILYFDAKGQPSDLAVKGGHYRKIIKKINEQEYWVQDFDGMNGKPHQSPRRIHRKQLMQFDLLK